MRRIFLFASVLLCLPVLSQVVKAQGGIGNMPRQDLVMLRAAVRDSLSDEVFARILDLKHYAEAGLLDSAAQIIAYNGLGTKDARWARAINLQNPDEKAYGEKVLDRVKKLFTEMPDTHREYYACFKDKENPAGQKHLYQINFLNGNKKRMVNWTFYPIGDKMMLGDFN